MAHQVHNIPWSNLSSNLTWRTRCPCRDDATDLHLRGRPDQGKKLHYFINAFTRNIKNHATIERAKFPAAYTPPDPEEVIISDAVACKITPSVAHNYHRYRRRGTVNHVESRPAPVCTRQKGGLCQGEHGDEFCWCVFPYAERKMKAFMRESTAHERFGTYDTRSWRSDHHHRGFFNTQLILILILYGEMDTLLRICAHPDNDVGFWRRHEDYMWFRTYGWYRIAEYALDTYILLNVIYNHTETWDSSRSVSENAKDYRNTRVYQEHVWRMTGRLEMDAATYPHRQFFGIPTDLTCYLYRAHRPGWDDRYRLMHPPGKFPYMEFLQSFEHCRHRHDQQRSPSEYVPLQGDVPHVRWILCEKGLPVEIAQIILDEADYTVRRRLPIPHDPFHRENWAELTSYLTYCWVLMIRCEVLAGEMREGFDWEKMVAESLIRLFDCRCSPRMYKPPRTDEDDWQFEFA